MSEPIQDVKFLPGIRQDVDRLSAPPGTLIDAQNVRYSISNGISGRNGTRTIAPTSDTLQRLLLNRSIGLVDQVSGYGVVGSTRETTQAGILVNYEPTRAKFGFQGYHSRALPVKRRGGVDANATTNYGSSRYAVAANTLGYVLLCASSGVAASGVRYIIQDSTGALLYSTENTGAQKVSGIALGTRFVIVIQTGTALTAIDIDTPASGAVAVSGSYAVGTLTSASAYWDICPDSTAANWYLVFQNGAATIRADRFATAATVSNANITTACTGTVPITAYQNISGLFIGYFDDPTVTGAVTFRLALSNLSGFSGAATVMSSDPSFSVPLIGPDLAGASGIAVAVYSQLSASNSSVALSLRRILTATTVSILGGIPGVVPLSKPTAQGHVWVMTGAPVINCGYQRAVLLGLASVASGQSPELVMPETERSGTTYMACSNRADMFATVATLPNGNAVFMVPELLQRSSSSAFPDAVRLSLVEYEYSAAYKDSISGTSIVVSGQPVEIPAQAAALIAVSGGASEVGFLDRIYVLATVASTLGSGVLTLLGTYSWIFVIEWEDAVGRRHRSAPSVPVTVTLTGTQNRVQFTVALALPTQRGALTAVGRPRLVPYRTLANQPDVFYRESTPLGATSITGSTTYIRICGDNAGETDAVVASNERLYTDGGVRSNAMAPSCRYLCESEDRVWCGGLWDPRIIQASKIVVPGEPLQFTDDFAFQVVIPDEVTGLAYLDGNVIAFCTNAIYTVSGDGPNDQGAGSFSSPRAICRDLGCIDYRSIVETSIGVLFQSTRGIYLLPRGLGNPNFVGMAVQDIMSAQGSGFTRVLAAASSQDSLNRLVRFLVENPAESTTRVLVYDLDVAQADPLAGWSYDTFSSRLSCIGNWPTGTFMSLYDLSSASICGYLDETASTFLTDASNTQDITSAIQTADLRYAGLAGQWRCDLVVGLMSTPTTGATVTITVTCDALTPDAVSWALTTATGSFYRQVTPAQPQCTAANVRFSCVRTAVRGPNFHGFSLELQAQPGARRTNSAER